ncbi:Anthrax toxin receptor-like, partial [Manis javanica]
MGSEGRFCLVPPEEKPRTALSEQRNEGCIGGRHTSVTCPGLKMKSIRGRAVFIDISLDNGLTFIETDLEISWRTCVTSR